MRVGYLRACTPIGRDSGPDEDRWRLPASRFLDAAWRVGRGSSTGQRHIADLRAIGPHNGPADLRRARWRLACRPELGVRGHESGFSPPELGRHRQRPRPSDLGVGDITRRLTPLYVVASGSAASDPEVAEVVDRHERWRVDGYRDMIEILRAKTPLRADLTPERANDLLLLYGGMDVYHALVEVAGWSHQEWIAWTRAMLAHQLFGIG
jgi:hypothetical protein